MNVFELFAGVGGFRLGLERASDEFNIVWGNQWEPSKRAQDAFDCYSRNFAGRGIHSNEDVSTVNFDDLPEECNLLVGGFPCQDYSVARTLSGEQGIEGKKGVLFWEIQRFVRHFQPNFVLLENVDRLLKSPSKQRGRDFAIMLAAFRDAGYSVEWRVINAAEYGFVQRRRRVFIFAYRNETDFAQILQNTNACEQIHQTGFFAPKFQVTQEENEKKRPRVFELDNDIVEVSDNFSETFLNSGRMKDGIVETYEVTPIESEKTPLSTILEEDLSNIEEKFFLLDSQKEKMSYLKGPKKIERVKDGFKYIFSEGGMSCPDDVTKPGRTMLTSEGTNNRSTHVVHHPGTERWRYLIPEECERLNGFDTGWTEGMTDRMRYFCMGNALVVNLVERMGERILEIE